jgi:hypothetical protein
MRLLSTGGVEESTETAAGSPCLSIEKFFPLPEKT